MPQMFTDFFSDMKLGMFLTVHFKDAVIVLLFKNFKNFRSCLNCPSPYIMSLFCDLFLPREDDINYEFNLRTQLQQCDNETPPPKSSTLSCTGQVF